MRLTEPSTEKNTEPARKRENKGHRGNGNPNRPSVIKRRERRAAERAQREAEAKREEKNRKRREQRAAAKVSKA